MCARQDEHGEDGERQHNHGTISDGYLDINFKTKVHVFCDVAFIVEQSLQTGCLVRKNLHPCNGQEPTRQPTAPRQAPWTFHTERPSCARVFTYSSKVLQRWLDAAKLSVHDHWEVYVENNAVVDRQAKQLCKNRTLVSATQHAPSHTWHSRCPQARTAHWLPKKHR